jgi:TonB family protein
VAVVAWCALSVYVWYWVIPTGIGSVASSRPEPPSEEAVRKALAAACSGASGADEAVPALRTNPLYPAVAERQGTEGWVELSFTIRPDGRVQDAMVLNSTPSDVFDVASVGAIENWRYCPRDSEFAATVRLTYELDSPPPLPACEEVPEGRLRKLCHALLGSQRP